MVHRMAQLRAQLLTSQTVEPKRSKRSSLLVRSLQSPFVDRTGGQSDLLPTKQEFSGNSLEVVVGNWLKLRGCCPSHAKHPKC